MAISDLSNSPIEFNLGSKTVKVSRISIKEFFATAEIKVKQSYLNNIQAVASILVGKEKIDYLTNATKDIPSGDKLNEASMEWVKSSDGVTTLLINGLNKHQKLSDEEIVSLVTNAGKGEIEVLIQYMIGIEDAVNTEHSDAASEQNPQKKT